MLTISSVPAFLADLEIFELEKNTKAHLPFPVGRLYSFVLKVYDGIYATSCPESCILQCSQDFICLQF